MILPSGFSTIDYSVRPNLKGWGAGWPACTPSSTSLKTVVSRNGARMPVNKGIADLSDILIAEVERRGYILVQGWCWGFSCRAIAGTSTPSNHSWGLAIDINAPKNPYTTSGVHDIPPWMFAIFRAYGFGVGADYSGPRKDYMHFEFMGNPRDAEIMAALALRAFGPASHGDTAVRERQPEQNAPAPSPAPTPAIGSVPSYPGWNLPAGHYLGPLSGPAKCHSGFPSTGDGDEIRSTIKAFQTRLRDLGYSVGTPDGLWGPQTSAATGKWQSRNLGGSQGIITSHLCGLNDFTAIHTYAQNREHSAPPFPGVLLREGMMDSPLVKQAQEHLRRKGFLAGVADGDFGPLTKDAVVRFQRRVGFTGKNVDGIIGPMTWTRLVAE